MFTWFLLASLLQTGLRSISAAGRATGQKRSRFVLRGGRKSHASPIRVVVWLQKVTSINIPLPISHPQLLTTSRYHLGTLHRLRPRTSTALRVHARPPASLAGLDAVRAALRRAVLGAQLVLRAHVLCAVARLGAHHRDS